MSRTIFQRIIDREIPATIEHEDNPAAWAKPIQLCRTLHETRLDQLEAASPRSSIFRYDREARRGRCRDSRRDAAFYVAE